MEEAMNTAAETVETIETEQTTQAAQPEQDTQAADTTTEPKQAKDESGKSSWRAELRRKAKEKEQEAAEANARLARLHGALQRSGYQGTPEEIADAVEAESRHMTLQELQAERQRIADAAKDDPAYKQAIAERDMYKQQYEQFLFGKHLDLIKTAHPEETASNIAELGETFLSLMALKQQQGDITDEDVLLAYDMAALEKQRKTKPVPESPGKVNKATSEEKDYYSPEDVERLTEAQLNNPKIIQTVMQSMTRWK